MNNKEYNEALIQKGYKKSPNLKFYNINQKLLKEMIMQKTINAPYSFLFYSKRKMIRTLLLNILLYKESNSLKIGTRQTLFSQIILTILSPITILIGGIPEFKKTLKYIFKNEIQQLDYLSNDDVKLMKEKRLINE